MSRLDSDAVLRPSVLDRLIDPELNRGDRHTRVDAARIVADVIRNLEALLNTHSALAESLVDSPLEHCRESVLNYGIPDLTPFSRTSGNAGHIADLIARAVKSFEPRLEKNSIRVTFVESQESGGIGGTLRFRIEGVLRVDPIREPIAFDTAVAVDSLTVAVTSG